MKIFQNGQVSLTPAVKKCPGLAKLKSNMMAGILPDFDQLEIAGVKF